MNLALLNCYVDLRTPGVYLSFGASFFATRVRHTGQALFRPPELVRPGRRTLLAPN